MWSYLLGLNIVFSFYNRQDTRINIYGENKLVFDSIRQDTRIILLTQYFGLNVDFDK